MEQFLKGIKQKTSGAKQRIADFFAPAPEVRTRDFIREIPYESLNTLQDIGQASMRAYAGIAGFLTGKPLTPETEFQKELYGTDKPITFRSVGEEVLPEGSKFAPALGAFFGVADIIPGGGRITRGTVGALVKARDAKTAVKELRRAGVGAREAEAVAGDLARATTEDQVESLLRDRGLLPKAAERAVSKAQEAKTKVFEGLEGLSTRLVEKFKGEPEVIKKGRFDELLNKAKKEGIRQADEELVTRMAARQGDQINLTKLADDVRQELLPLEATPVKVPRWSHIGEDFIGQGRYGEVVYQSPVKTSAGDVHFRTQRGMASRGGLNAQESARLEQLEIKMDRVDRLPAEEMAEYQRLAAKRSAGRDEEFPRYFSHVRYEDMADGTTRKILETQSDLMQKGNLDREISQIGLRGEGLTPEVARRNEQLVRKYIDGTLTEAERVEWEKITKARNLEAQKVVRGSELNRLRIYETDTNAHLRTFREEVNRAAKDGKNRILIPDGETAMRIEGLGSEAQGFGWEILREGQRVVEPGARGSRADLEQLTPRNIKVGQRISRENFIPDETEWIVTEVLPDGKFRAVPKNVFESKGIDPGILAQRGAGSRFTDIEGIKRFEETFDISGKIDTSHFVYGLNEKDLVREARRLGLEVAGKVEADNGKWWEIKVPKGYGQPVEAFGAFAGIEEDPETGEFKFDPLKAGLGVGVAGFARRARGDEGFKSIGEFLKGADPEVRRAIDTSRKLTASEIAGLPRTQREALRNNPELATVEGLKYLKSRGRGVVTNVESQRLAEELGWTKEKVLRTPPGTAMASEEVAAVGGLVQNQRNIVRRLEEAVKQKPDLVEELAKQKVDLARMEAVLVGVSEESGRSLQVLKKQWEAIDSEMAKVNKFLASKKATEAEKEFVYRKIAESASDPAVIAELLPKLQKASIWDMIAEFATAVKLYAIPTHVVNVATSIARTGMHIPLRVASAMIDTTVGRLYGGQRQRFLREAQAEVVGQWAGWKNAPKRAFQAILDEQYTAKTKKFEDFTPRIAIQGRLGKETKFDKFLDVFGKGVRMSFRALGVEDALIRAPAEAGALYTLATRKAMMAGLKPGTKAFNDDITETITNPSVDILEQMAKYGDEALFQEDITSEALKTVDKLRRVFIVRIVVPFYKTIVNLVRQGIEFSPLSPILPRTREAFKTRGEASDAMAKMAIGTSALIPLTMHALEGNITLAAPTNPGQRDAFYAEGKQPYSIKVGDKWYPYSRTEPFASWLSNAAIIAKAINNEDEEEVATAMAKAVLEASKNVTDKTFMIGLSDALEAITDPASGKARRFTQNLVVGATYPTIFGNIARARDPVIRETKTIGDLFKARTPGMSEELPARMDVFGEEIERPGTFWQRLISPIVPSEVREDPVRKELENIGYNMGYPSGTAYGQKLPDEAFRVLKGVSGKVVYQELKNLFESPRYQRMSITEKEKAVNKIVGDTRADVREIVGREQAALNEMKNFISDEFGLPDPEAQRLAEKIQKEIKERGMTLEDLLQRN